MLTRVLDTRNGYIPQRKVWYSGWQEITDEQLEREREDDYNFDAHQSAEDCAVRYTKAHGGSCIGTVKKRESLLTSFRNYFRGPVGPHGYQGCQGAKGDAGAPARRSDDLQCPHCLKHRTDHPHQMLMLEVADDNVFLFTCKKCSKDSMWLNYHGLLLNERSIKR